MELNLSTNWTILLAILAIWELAWKGMALWRTGRKNQPGWFISLLLLNTAGILPIVYLLTNRKEEQL